MTAIEAAAVASAWILAVFRLLRTGVPLLRLTDSRWSLAVIACIPILPQVASALAGVETKLDFADAVLQSAVALTAAVRGMPATDAAKVLVIGLFAFVSQTACNSESYAAHVERVAQAHAATCETCDGDAVRSILSGEELEDYELACENLCAVRCEARE